jgi:hypothetical protein
VPRTVDRERIAIQVHCVYISTRIVVPHLSNSPSWSVVYDHDFALGFESKRYRYHFAALVAVGDTMPCETHDQSPGRVTVITSLP